MRHTCINVLYMSKMIQIRNVPDEIHREIKARAARAGMSLSEYLLREIERVTGSPSVEEILREFAGRQRPPLSETPTEAVRAERDSH